MEKHQSHLYYQVKDGILYEWYKKSRGINCIILGKVEGAPDQLRCPDKIIKTLRIKQPENMITAYKNLNINQRINLKHNFEFAQLQRKSRYQLNRSWGAAQYMLRLNRTHKVRNIDVPVPDKKHQSLFIHRDFYDKLTH